MSEHTSPLHMNFLFRQLYPTIVTTLKHRALHDPARRYIRHFLRSALCRSLTSLLSFVVLQSIHGTSPSCRQAFALPKFSDIESLQDIISDCGRDGPSRTLIQQSLDTRAYLVIDFGLFHCFCIFHALLLALHLIRMSDTF